MIGLIAMDIAITAHLLFSILFADQWCLSDGYFTAFTFVCGIFYNLSLTHCVLTTIRKFQPKKRTRSIMYHLVSVCAGLVYIGLAAVFDDIGPGVMETCAMAEGSTIE